MTQNPPSAAGAPPLPSMGIYGQPQVAALIRTALAEDLGVDGDITCQTLVRPGARLDATIRAKSPGVVCGLPVLERVVATLGGTLSDVRHHPDGAVVSAGEVVLQCRGDAALLLIAERTALNICQRLSGTATMTRRYVTAVAGTRAQVFDTRKTTPGLRLLEKHAVIAGGGCNHRLGLFDQVLIKDNHIALMTPSQDTQTRSFCKAAEAVRRCRASLGAQVLIEVEIETVDDLEAVIAAGADIVLLDNMAPPFLAQAVERRDRACTGGRRPVQLEASGGITLESIRAYALSGVDRISSGALTHSVQALDLSMRCTLIDGP